MSYDTCRRIAKAMGNSETEARRLCADLGLQRCTRFMSGEERTLEAFAACYGSSKEGQTDVRLPRSSR